VDGKSIPRDQYLADLSIATAIAGVDLPPVATGTFGWSIGIGSFGADGFSGNALGMGMNYGISNNLSLYGKGAVDLTGSNSWSSFIGLQGHF
jgi:hypothetical protein